MDYQPPPFFSRGPAPLVRLGFFVSLAVLLMVLDARFRYAESLRQAVAFLVYPFQRTALAPVELLSAASELFTAQVASRRANACRASPPWPKSSIRGAIPSRARWSSTRAASRESGPARRSSTISASSAR